MKFSFGEKVKIKDTGEIFTITHVRLIFPEIGLQYWGNFSSYTSKVYAENELELYQEPQKKKLYAFEDQKGRVFFALDEPCFVGCRPLPDYDLEYPSEEVK